MSRASEQAYSQIRGMILSGTLPPGEQIREEWLAEQCGVSRTPVREALRRLESELFIRRTERQRSFVADWSLDDIEDAFVLRALMEGLAARRAAERITPSQLALLKTENAAIGHAVSAKSPNVLAFLKHNKRFHEIILEAAASPRLTNLLARLIEQPVVWRTAQSYDVGDLQRSHRDHDELLAAFARKDGEWAESVMAGHIRRAFHTYADAHLGKKPAPITP